jgi:transglutaminase/protease-like cytokinesis protein 3
LKKSPKLIGKVISQVDKIDDIIIKPDGTVNHKWLRITLNNTPKKGENKKKA